MEVLLFFLFAAFILTIIIVASVAHSKKIRTAWSSFAAQHGLTFSGGSLTEKPNIEGRYQGIQINIYTEVHGSGKNRRTYTRYNAYFTNPLPAGLNISAEGFGDKIAKWLGGQDIQVGIDELDSALRIKGEAEQEIIDLLSDSRLQSAVVGFVGGQHGVITEFEATILDRNMASNVAVLQSRLEATVQVVQHIENARSERQGARAASGSPHHGDIQSFEQSFALSSEESLNRHTEARRESQQSSNQTPEEDLLGDNGSPAQYVPDNDQSDPKLKPQPVPEAEQKSKSKPQPEPELEAPPAKQPTERTAGTAPPDEAAPSSLLSTLKKLADPLVSSTEKNQLFEQIKGKHIDEVLTVESVSWTLSLHVSDRMRDGQTAVGTLTGDSAAAVAFPKEREDEVKELSRGTELWFSGVIVHWDDIYDRVVIEADDKT